MGDSYARFHQTLSPETTLFTELTHLSTSPNITYVGATSLNGSLLLVPENLSGEGDIEYYEVQYKVRPASGRNSVEPPLRRKCAVTVVHSTWCLMQASPLSKSKTIRNPRYLSDPKGHRMHRPTHCLIIPVLAENCPRALYSQE